MLVVIVMTLHLWLIMLSSSKLSSKLCNLMLEDIYHSHHLILLRWESLTCRTLLKALLNLKKILINLVHHLPAYSTRISAKCMMRMLHNQHQLMFMLFKLLNLQARALTIWKCQITAVVDHRWCIKKIHRWADNLFNLTILSIMSMNRWSSNLQRKNLHKLANKTSKNKIVQNNL